MKMPDKVNRLKYIGIALQVIYLPVNEPIQYFLNKSQENINKLLLEKENEN